MRTPERVYLRKFVKQYISYNAEHYSLRVALKLNMSAASVYAASQWSRQVLVHGKVFTDLGVRHRRSKRSVTTLYKAGCERSVSFFFKRDMPRWSMQSTPTVEDSARDTLSCSLESMATATQVRKCRDAVFYVAACRFSL